MFKNLTKFGFNRNWKQAIGFYFAYLLLIAIACGMAGGIGGIIVGEIDGAFELGAKIGNIIAIFCVLAICFLVLKEKRLNNNFGYILLALSSGLIAIFLGALGGLIPAAYLTTKKFKTNNHNHENNSG